MYTGKTLYDTNDNGAYGNPINAVSGESVTRSSLYIPQTTFSAFYRDKPFEISVIILC
jgi:hypothetical protein